MCRCEDNIAHVCQLGESSGIDGDIVLASTHDLELATLLKDQYDLYHFCETVTDNKLSFDYTLKPGVVKEGNAIRILELCNYPKDVIDVARTVANKKRLNT